MTEIAGAPLPQQSKIGARFLVRSGLLWAVNDWLLHPLGLSLAMSQADPDDEDGTGPVQLSLSADPEGRFTFALDIDARKHADWSQFVDLADELREAILTFAPTDDTGGVPL